MNHHYIPSGQRSIAPFFLIEDATGFIDFLVRGFHAEQLLRIERDGLIMNALVQIGDSLIMVGSRKTQHFNSTHLYVPNVDQTFERCLMLGAEVVSPPRTFDYGDRSAGIKDPFGNTWWLGTHLGQPGPMNTSSKTPSPFGGEAR